MIHVSPTLRLSLSFAVLTVSLLLFAELLGLIPDTRRVLMDARQKVCESLAVQLSIGASRSDHGLVRETLDAFVERNPDVLSAAMRRENGEIFIQTAEHPQRWAGAEVDRSTMTHVQVPVFAGEQRWGTVEASFAAPSYSNWLEWLRSSIWGLLLFTGMAGFAAYYLVLRRALRELDPRGTIPQRVKSAFDALVEGVVILDDKKQIVLANTAFTRKAGLPSSSLLGRRAEELEWRNIGDDSRPAVLPWEQTFKSGAQQVGSALRLLDARSDKRRTLMASSAAILDDKKKVRGVLVSFNDVTLLEKRNKELHNTINLLRVSEDEIKQKNEQLSELAMRDPLTGCLNRRAFFSAFEGRIRKVHDEGLVLSCLMADIDHFKSINDRFGHDVGDKVIKWMTEMFKSQIGADDILCRYGGEEFCMVLSGVGVFRALTVAQNIRRAVEKNSAAHFGGDLRVTISIGVSSVQMGAKDTAALIKQADQALYLAKQGGRNCVVRWNPEAVGNLAIHPTARGMEAPDAGETAEAPQHQGSAGTLPSSEALAQLPGQIKFAERIAQEIARPSKPGKRMAVISLVPNHYRRVKDTLGPAIAEALLNAVSQRLLDTVRTSDMVARLAGAADVSAVSRLDSGEFGILLIDLDDERSVTDALHRMFLMLAQPLEVSGHALDLDISAGVAILPQGGDSPEQVLKNAALARHHACVNVGANRYQIYAEELEANSPSAKEPPVKSEVT